MDRLRERANFLKNAIFDFKVGAVTMSSKYVVQNVIKRLKMPLNMVVEYGPGGGVVTKALLKHLSPQGKVFVIESNPQFIKVLRKIPDKRLKIISGKVQDLEFKKFLDFSRVDVVVSSIPFSILTPMERAKVISATHKILAPGRSFIIFHQYSRLMAGPLKKSFKSVSVSFELRNILPCFILEAKK